MKNGHTRTYIDIAERPDACTRKILHESTDAENINELSRLAFIMPLLIGHIRWQRNVCSQRGMQGTRHSAQGHG